MFPNEYIINSDYSTLKNDTQTNELQITISAGTIFDPNDPQLGSVDLEVGTINAGLRARASSTKFPGIWNVGVTMYSTILTSVPSQPSIPQFTSALYCNLERISPSTLRLSVATEGVGGTPPNFRVDDTQTITFVFSTFLSPFN